MPSHFLLFFVKWSRIFKKNERFYVDIHTFFINISDIIIYFAQWCEELYSKHCLVQHFCSWHDKLASILQNNNTVPQYCNTFSEFMLYRLIWSKHLLDAYAIWENHNSIIFSKLQIVNEYVVIKSRKLTKTCRLW